MEQYASALILAKWRQTTNPSIHLSILIEWSTMIPAHTSCRAVPTEPSIEQSHCSSLWVRLWSSRYHKACYPHIVQNFLRAQSLEGLALCCSIIVLYRVSTATFLISSPFLSPSLVFSGPEWAWSLLESSPSPYHPLEKKKKQRVRSRLPHGLSLYSSNLYWSISNSWVA